MKGKKKFAIIAPLVATIAMGFTGCTQAEKDEEKTFNREVLNVLNNSPVVSQVVETNFERFDFLGADFEETTQNDYDVDINGIARYANKKAFVKMSYTFDGKNFENINENKQSEILKVLRTLIGKEEMKKFDFVEVGSVKNLNGTIRSYSQSPLEDYDYNNGLIFSLSNVKFDEENGAISFRMKSFVEYAKEETVLTPIPIIDSDGMTTIIPTPIKKTDYKNFIHNSNVAISVTNEEMMQMKNDHSLIFDKFVELVNSDSKDQYVVNQVSSEEPTKFDTSAIDKIEDIENEIG